MSEHPIEGLMSAAMNSIKDMIDVDTIIGNTIAAPDGTIIIPVSKVSFGFAAGGSEFNGETIDEYSKAENEESILYKLPFGGGSGAGVNITPVAFMVVQNNNVKLLPVDHTSTLDKLADYIPDIFDKINNMISQKCKAKEDTTINYNFVENNSNCDCNKKEDSNSTTQYYENTTPPQSDGEDF